MIGYVTVAEADEYVTTHFTFEDPLRESWEDLEEEDKEILLRRSFETLEALPFSGHKTDFAQPNAFPRCPSTEVPKAVIAAQIENAVSMCDSQAAEDAAYYGKLWQFGVESYSIGNLSERIGQGSWGSGTSAAVTGIVSATAMRLIKPFLQGSYNIRRG